MCQKSADPKAATAPAFRALESFTFRIGRLLAHYAIENRARFLIEVVEAVTGAIGAGKVGVRLSPTNSYFGISDSQPGVTFPMVAAMLSRFNLAYLHIFEPKPASGIAPVTHLIRAAYKGTFIRNGGYDRQSGFEAINTGEADAVAFGVPFIANPDLVDRYRHNFPLAQSDPETYYTPGRQGYADYPAYRQQTRSAA